jgi:tol-pal system protein YbgF
VGNAPAATTNAAAAAAAAAGQYRRSVQPGAAAAAGGHAPQRPRRAAGLRDAQLKEQSLERYLDIDRRLDPAAAPAVPSRRRPRDRRRAGRPAPAPAIRIRAGREQPGEGEAYRAAYALVRGQEFDAAVDAFTTFLDSYPDGRYAPNAHYWLGELYLVIEPADPEAARQSFMLLLNQYPGQRQGARRALQARSRAVHQGQQRARPGILERVMREYPDSSAARLAGDFLDQNLWTAVTAVGASDPAAAPDTLRITEIFYSLQGEARTVGLPTVFVRLTGCPLRCVYCDTAYAFQGGELLTLGTDPRAVAAMRPPT